jgi:hypothetical protein
MPVIIFLCSDVVETQHSISQQVFCALFSQLIMFFSPIDAGHTLEEVLVMQDIWRKSSGLVT